MLDAIFFSNSVLKSRFSDILLSVTGGRTDELTDGRTHHLVECNKRRQEGKEKGKKRTKEGKQRKKERKFLICINILSQVYNVQDR